MESTGAIKSLSYITDSDRVDVAQLLGVSNKILPQLQDFYLNPVRYEMLGLGGCGLWILSTLSSSLCK